jgi:hypothetical protein
MGELFKGDGDSWRVTVDRHDRRRAVETFVFHCVSNSQRPYRVIEVPEDVLGGRSVESLSGKELAELFAGTHTMDYTHDRAAVQRLPATATAPRG